MGTLMDFQKTPLGWFLIFGIILLGAAFVQGKRDGYKEGRKQLPPQPTQITLPSTQPAPERDPLINVYDLANGIST